MTQTTFISSPLLKEGKLESRQYQIGMAAEASEKDSLVVLPTGLGKTPIILLLVLSKYQDGPVLVMAPTRPLVEQHARFFRGMMAVPEEEIGFVHGLISPSERSRIYSTSKVIISTPQTIESDLEEGLALKLSLVCFDEAHRAIGGYSYCNVARRLRAYGSRALFLGLTASPGTTGGEIDEVCDNLGLEKRLFRTREDPDVLPYVHSIPEIVVEVEMEPLMVEALKTLNQIAQPFYDKANNLGRPDFFKETLGPTTPRKRIFGISKAVSKSISGGNAPNGAFSLASSLAALGKLRHAILMAETQGSFPLYDYLASLDTDTTRAAGMIKKADGFKPLLRSLLESCYHEGGLSEGVSPKFEKILELVEAQLDASPESKLMVFTNFRSTGEQLHSYLSRQGTDRVKPVKFTGQSKSRVNPGMSQRDQRDVMEAFRAGRYNVLVSTSVGEEGIDVPMVDVVIQHEPPNSPIRSVQRRGRGARVRAGKCYVLVSVSTSDELNLMRNRQGEKQMNETLTKKAPNQTTLGGSF